jgi:carbon storage regulator
MLVLSRQRDETIMIGDEIEISVVDIRGDKVRIGINAPTRIAVHRKEVYDAIRAENTQASRLGASDLDSIAQTITPGPQRRQSGQAPSTKRPVPTTMVEINTKKLSSQKSSHEQEPATQNKDSA